MQQHVLLAHFDAQIAAHNADHAALTEAAVALEHAILMKLKVLALLRCSLIPAQPPQVTPEESGVGTGSLALRCQEPAVLQAKEDQAMAHNAQIQASKLEKAGLVQQLLAAEAQVRQKPHSLAPASVLAL